MLSISYHDSNVETTERNDRKQNHSLLLHPKVVLGPRNGSTMQKKIHSTATWAAKMLKRRHIVFCAGSASHSPSSTLAPPVCLCPVGATPPSKWLDDKANLYFQIVQGLSEHPPCTEWHATTVTEDHQRHKLGHRYKIRVFQVRYEWKKYLFDQRTI